MRRAFVMAAALLMAAAPAAAQESRVRLVTMTGAGTVQAEPNRVWVSVGIEARAEAPPAARQQAASTMEAIQRRLQALGIPDSAVRTSFFSVSQDWTMSQGQRVPRGYLVSNQVEIRVDDVKKLPAVIDASIAAGANNIRGVRWDLTNRESLEHQAIQRAYADARARAEVIATASGSKLGELYAAQEARAGAIRPTTAYEGSGLAQAVTVTDTPVSPGLIDIRATVTVSWVLQR